MPESLEELALQADDLLVQHATSADGIRACVPLMHRALDEKWHLAALHQLLRQTLAGTREVTPDLSSGQFVVLAASRTSTWAVLRHGSKSRRLYMTPNHYIAARVAGGELHVDRYELPAISDEAVLDPGAALVPRGSSKACLGEIFLKEGRTDVLDLEAPEQPAFTLRLNTAPYGDYEWAFERATLRPIKISAVRQLESNLTTIFELLRSTGCLTSLEHLLPFVDHRMHFIRWNAIKAIGAIDVDAGLAQVRRAADDPHPDVRHAARQTLAANAVA